MKATSIRWTMAAGLGALALVSYLTRANISVAAETMMPALGISAIKMGQIFSSFLIGYAIFQIPGGILGDRLGPRLTLATSALLWAVATLLTGLAPRFAGGSTTAIFVILWAIRFLLGAAQATTFPVGNRVVHNWMAPSDRALGGSIMFMGTSTATAITGPLMPMLIQHFGWQGSFYIGALPPLLFAAFWYLWSRDLPEQHPRVNAAEAALIRGQDIPQAREPEAAVPLLSLLRQPNVLLLVLSYISEGYVLFMFVFWLYIYLVEQRHLSMVRGGWMSALPWLTALVLTPVGGKLCDRIAIRRGRLAGSRAILMAGYGVSGAMLFAAAYAGSAALSVAALSLSIAFLMASESAFWSAATHLAGTQVGALSGVMNTAGILGGIVSTSLVPVLVKHFGWLAALSSGTVMAFASVTLWIAVRERAPRPTA